MYYANTILMQLPVPSPAAWFCSSSPAAARTARSNGNPQREPPASVWRARGPSWACYPSRQIERSKRPDQQMWALPQSGQYMSLKGYNILNEMWWYDIRMYYIVLLLHMTFIYIYIYMLSHMIPRIFGGIFSYIVGTKLHAYTCIAKLLVIIHSVKYHIVV